MKAAMIRSHGSLTIERMPVPEPSAQQILLRTNMCGLCSSDIAVFSGAVPKRLPYSPGHEFWGTVEATGMAVSGVRVGERVVVDPNLGCGECACCRGGRPNLCDNLKTGRAKSNGGFCEFVAVDHRMAHRMPDGLSGAGAVFVEPLSCALHAVDRLGVGEDGRVVVLGAGFLGLAAGIVLRGRVPQVVFSEPSPGRREDVRRILGLEALPPDALESGYGPQSFDRALDCTGNPRAMAQAIRLLKKGGRLVLAGIVGEPGVQETWMSELTMRELEIVGTWLNPGTFGDAMAVAVEFSSLLDQFAVEYTSIDALAEAFERGGGSRAVKTIVRF